MTPTLYLTRNGLMEPLGQSQVLAYLRGLSKDYRVTLITYEKDEDRNDAARFSLLRTECERLGIRWLPQRFRPRPKVIAPAFSMLRMVWLVRREVRGQHAQLIHARSYIPAAVAMIVSRMTGVPFIFDMRALWPEELITAGRLRRRSILHQAIVTAERACLKSAAGVVSLTHAAVKHLRQIYPSELANQRIVVIPTCADLERFVPAKKKPDATEIGCLGTVLSGWFKLDWLVSFLSVAVEQTPNAKIVLTTRDNPEEVRAAFRENEAVLERLKIAPSPSDQVPDVLRGQTASVMFFTEGLSKLGSSPTRMGEILGCGMPVVANDGVGDVAAIIRKYDVGVLVDSASKEDMNAAWDKLLALLEDPDLPDRCRRAAEEVFSLASGVSIYRNLYEDILQGSSA
ncbi:glycosyltransferase [Thioclava nitratireducens]|uniref:glycosyltransferase n=1 Tax=Thioclava nitratireducens TaxID=1915078 RepID=UPI0024812A65|nr:glycosyltransferase [Thioclava nitratireducens]WGT51481.1 glycosyltransferase [Thioclava nitratireducens]